MIKYRSDMTDRGLNADLRALIAQDDVADEGEQLALEIFDDFASPVGVQLEHRQVARRPGRPPGAKNRAGVNVVRLIKATKRPTLLTLKEWADLPLADFMKATGIEKAADAFAAWFRVAELVTAYEEGRPTQRVEVDGKGGVVLPVVLFGDPPVRPDLVDGNPPDDGAMVNVTDWEKQANTIASQGVDDEGSPTKAHDPDEDVDWAEQSGS